MDQMNPNAGPVGPVAGMPVLVKTQTPDSVASNVTSVANSKRTEGSAAAARVQAREAAGTVEWKQGTDGEWVGLPKKVGDRGEPVRPVTTTVPGKRQVQAGRALDIIDQAEKLIDSSTGSYAGAGIDQAGRMVGISTPGAQAGAKLKALEGALMMAQPRMEGPQSDKDTALYRQMAGQIGDPTAPAAQKKAALVEIKGLHQKYADPGRSAAAPMVGGGLSAQEQAELDALRKRFGK